MVIFIFICKHSDARWAKQIESQQPRLWHVILNFDCVLELRTQVPPCYFSLTHHLPLEIILSLSKTVLVFADRNYALAVYFFAPVRPLQIPAFHCDEGCTFSRRCPWVVVNRWWCYHHHSSPGGQGGHGRAEQDLLFANLDFAFRFLLSLFLPPSCPPFLPPSLDVEVLTVRGWHRHARGWRAFTAYRVWAFARHQLHKECRCAHVP